MIFPLIVIRDYCDSKSKIDRESLYTFLSVFSGMINIMTWIVIGSILFSLKYILLGILIVIFGTISTIVIVETLCDKGYYNKWPWEKK